MYVCVPGHSCLKSPEEGLDALGLGVGSCLLWALVTEPRSSGRASSGFNCGVMSPAHILRPRDPLTSASPAPQLQMPFMLSALHVGGGDRTQDAQFPWLVLTESLPSPQVSRKVRFKAGGPGVYPPASSVSWSSAFKFM